jgi:predicted nucleic acid-binding protein
MPNVIVSDTSCLILLSKIGELELLERLYGEIIITEVVKSEFIDPLPSWIKTVNPSHNFSIGLK